MQKPIIDELDAALAEHYGFTVEEPDFISIRWHNSVRGETGLLRGEWSSPELDPEH